MSDSFAMNTRRRAGRTPPPRTDLAPGSTGRTSSMGSLRRAYALMRAKHGHQNWWPAETPFEVCVGAILTQNTAWKNVAQAILRLRTAGALEPGVMYALPESELAQLVRPAGYFNVKARRLRAFLQVLIEGHG